MVDAWKGRERVTCCVLDLLFFFTFANVVETLKYDKSLVKHLFLISMHHYVCYDKIYKSRSMFDMFQKNS